MIAVNDFTLPKIAGETLENTKIRIAARLGSFPRLVRLEDLPQVPRREPVQLHD